MFADASTLLGRGQAIARVTYFLAQGAACCLGGSQAEGVYQHLACVIKKKAAIERPFFVSKETLKGASSSNHHLVWP